MKPLKRYTLISALIIIHLSFGFTHKANDGIETGSSAANTAVTLHEHVEENFGINITSSVNYDSTTCGITKTHVGNCWTTEVVSVTPNNGKFDIQILVTYTGVGGCKKLSHFSVEADDNSFSNVSWSPVSGNPTGNIELSLGNNDPFDGFKLDNVNGIGNGMAGSFTMNYTLDFLQDQQFLAKAGNDYTQIASFLVADFTQIANCSSPPCDTADNSTSTAEIREGETKTLVGSPSGGTWSIVSGGGSISGTTYTPADINTDTDVTIRYTIAADGSCTESTDDVTFTVTPICLLAVNSTATASITEDETKTLVGSPSGGTWSIVSGGGSISGTTYTPADINTNTDVTIRYTIAADGSCSETSADVTFTVTPVCVTAVNSTATASITEDETKTLSGSPSGGTWSIVSGGGSISGTTYTPADINTNTDVTIRYTIAADGSCSETSADVTFTVTAALLGSIGDRVWFDTDGDTNQDTEEPGLVGATVTLDPGTPGNTTDDVTTTTGADGLYLFENLPAGEYTITVDVSTVTDGIPAGKTVADLVQNYDYDGLGTANKSTYNLGSGEHNREQDFGYVVTTDPPNCGGNCGGVESESLGDAITKIYVGRKKNSVPTEFVKDKSNRYDKKKLQGLQVYQGKGQTMLDMFPEELVPGDVSHVTSPTDILDYTIADEVLSVDFSLNGKTQGVVLGIKTTDRVYNHTKASCDRLRGAEVLNVQTIHLHGHDFLMQALQQRNGSVEYAISFAIGKNNNDNFYDLQTSWYVNHYNKFNDMYNFQVWSTNPTHTKKLLVDIMNNLNSYIPVKQESYPATPMTFASKIYRDKSDLVIKLRSTETGKNADIEMIELYSETANNIKHRFNTVTTTKEQEIRIDIADGYEYDGLIKIDGNIQDAFYHADGNWGLDFDKRYTEIKNYFVWNDFNRTYRDDELPINRNVELKATSDYDYLMLYKSLLPGNISADYNQYSYLAFTAKGAGMIELGLLKASIQDWKEQYRVMVEFSEEEQTYYVPFEIFTSMASQEKINADDLTTIIFNWLPTDSNSTELDLEVSDVRFVKKASDDGVLVEPIITYDNQYLAYPNPSEGHLTTLLFSDKAVEATVTLHDITGKIVYRSQIRLQEGKNEIDLNFNVSPGIMLLNIATNEHNFGTTKIIFR